MYPASFGVNPRGRLCYKYKYSGSYRLTYFRKFHWNSSTVIDFNSQQTQLLSQNATFSFFFDPVKFRIWKSFLAIMVSKRYHWKMFQFNKAFAFLGVIGFVTLGSKVTFSGRSAAFSSLSQRSRFHLPKNFISLIWRINNALSDQTSCVGKIRAPEGLYRPANDPGPQMIPKLYHKWSRTGNDRQIVS